MELTPCWWRAPPKGGCCLANPCGLETASEYSTRAAIASWRSSGPRLTWDVTWPPSSLEALFGRCCRNNLHCSRGGSNGLHGVPIQHPGGVCIEVVVAQKRDRAAPFVDVRCAYNESWCARCQLRAWVSAQQNHLSAEVVSVDLNVGCFAPGGSAEWDLYQDQHQKPSQNRNSLLWTPDPPVRAGCHQGNCHRTELVQHEIALLGHVVGSEH